MPVNASLIIRAKNEAATLPRLLDLISHQSLAPNEIILIDNQSTDGTPTIAHRHGLRVINIPPESFSHAHSCNLGAQASHCPYLIYTNAHSFPCSFTWLKAGLSHFSNSQIGGVFGPSLPDTRASVWERLAHSVYSHTYHLSSLQYYRSVRLLSGGLLATTNCIIKKSLWQTHPFDESRAFSQGGEDTELGLFLIKSGYVIAMDPKFAVYHCHGDNLLKLLRRQYYYISSMFPSYFRYRFAPPSAISSPSNL